ncbi:MAG: hypothetical protein R3B49_00730 [Phycisphaerales bacterium]
MSADETHPRMPDESEPPARPGLNPYEQTVRQRKLLLRVVRVGFVILFATVTGLSLFGGGLAGQDAPLYWKLTLTVAFAVAGVVVAIDLMTPTKKISTIVSVIVGLIAAMLATVAIGFIIDLLAQTYGDINPNDNPVISILKILIGTGLAYLAISTVLQTQDDFRLVIPYVEFAKQIRGSRPLVLDTSALIDARIADLGDTGVVQSPLIIPRFVVEELQQLSDSGEKMKRAKGRRGLDLIGRLQRAGRLDVTIDNTPIPGVAVDQMLVELAQQLNALIVTTDSGLARVAQIRGVSVINMNEVANAVKLTVIPGQVLRVTLTKAGEQPGQGVGYLDDGTMVVAEDGGDLVGEDVELTVTSSMQTSAGRLIFGRVGGERETPPEREPPRRPEPERPHTPKPRPETSARNPRR